MQKLSRLALAILASSILSAEAETLVALTSDKKLQHFTSSIPGVFTKTVNLTGIPAAESGAALDFRADGTLIVFTREGALLRPYLVDPNTGAAVSSPFAELPASANAVAFDVMPKDAHGFDLILATEADTLRRFTVSPGHFTSISSKTLAFDNDAADGDPVDENAGADPAIIALGSTNGFAGARATVIYGIESLKNALVKIDYDTGSIDTIATLRNNAGAVVRVGSRTGLDISGLFGTAYLMLGLGNSTTLLSVDLTTGETTDLGAIGPEVVPDTLNLVDIATVPPTQLVNLATRSRVGTGEDVMISGFISQGATPSRLIIRGIGPSLLAAGVANALADPVLTIFDGNGVQFATNDNWKSNQQNQIQFSGLAPSNDLEAAFFGSFPPGQYTAIVSGKDGGTGVGLVEIYKLPDL